MLRILLLLGLFYSTHFALRAQLPLDTSANISEEVVAEDVPAPKEEAEVLPEPAPVRLKPIDSETWQKASEVPDYSSDIPKVQRSRQRNPAPNRDLPDLPTFDWVYWGETIRYILIGLIVLIVAWGVYKMLQQPRDRAIYASDGTEITLDNVEAYIHETDLERFLREALLKGDYQQAVRLYFLQVIKDLSEKSILHWSKEKTNREYLRELRSHDLAPSFRRAMGAYEQVWYGKTELDQPRFERIEQDMKKALAQIALT